jgi:cytochrome c peroxidase
MKTIKLTSTLLLLAVTMGCNDGGGSSSKIDLLNVTPESLGKILYHDTSLSQNRMVSCATCHSESNAFIDKRASSSVGFATSASADNSELGERNVPSLAYISYTPEFLLEKDEENKTAVQGGFFWDGRAKNLEEQAKVEFLDSSKMQMESRYEVIERVKDNDNYVAAFRKLYGDKIFDDVNRTYDALAESIAAFEKTKFFSSFDSKYDKKQQGKYSFSDTELQGLNLFKDKHRANCVSCHPLYDKEKKVALFTNYSYANIGVPVNGDLRDVEDANKAPDYGLLNGTAVTDQAYEGAFKVPTLRNVAVTAPYMHNGVFKDLKTVVHFFNTRDLKSGINPETDNPWEDAEIKFNVNHRAMGALRLTDEEEDALVAFLQTLTDARYEK